MSNINNGAIVYTMQVIYCTGTMPGGGELLANWGQYVAYDLLTKPCALVQDCTPWEKGVPFSNSHEGTVWASIKRWYIGMQYGKNSEGGM